MQRIFTSLAFCFVAMLLVFASIASAKDGIVEINGIVQAMPATPIGDWTIAGKKVRTDAATRIKQEVAPIAVGALVEVKGTLTTDGAVLAQTIEVKQAPPGSPPPPQQPPSGVVNIEWTGAIDAMPATPIGTWTVAGVAVVVDANTVLEAEHGTFAVGVLVEVHATKRPDGSLLATKVERKAGVGAPVPASRFWGTVTALPASGLVGLWKIDGSITVDVLASTEIHVNNGPIAVGAIVEVHGWPQADGVVVAEEIETRSSVGQMPSQGNVVVEFRNTKLGHFFLTASQAEIAALDAGAFSGAWKRTGETFKVGGNQAVCRFYGMPPNGPDSHFYTASAAECAHVLAEFAAWTFEDHAFAITEAAAGQCPAGLVPVHRFFNNAARADDMNHRFTVSAAAFDATLAMGWIHEGVVMCAQP